MRREIIISFGRDPNGQPPGPLKRLLVGVLVAAIALAVLVTILVLGLSLLLIIWAAIAIAVVATIIRRFLTSPGPVNRH